MPPTPDPEPPRSAGPPRTLFTAADPAPTQRELLDEQRQTRETWELEMLLSGGVTVGLLQVPALIGGTFDAMMPHATRGVGIFLLLGYVYASAIVYSLIATFLTHLVARAYWVGLIGLNSVFPHGPDWDRLAVGPIARDVMRERMPPLDAQIARVDRFCRIIFSFGFLVVIVGVISVLAAALTALVMWVASRFGAPRDVQLPIAAALAAVVFVPALLATILDKTRAGHIDPRSRTGRAIARLVRFQQRTQLAGAMTPIQATLFSNLRSKGIRVVFFLTFAGALLLAFATMLRRLDGLEVNSYDYFAERGVHTVRADSYDSMAPEAMRAIAPSIQADIVRDPYVRLFVPYQPERHNNAIAALCRGVPRVESRGLRLDLGAEAVPDSVALAVLACIQRLHPVRLDGAGVDVTYRFHQHPVTSVKGFVAYLPVAALPPGEHELRVGRVPTRAWLQESPGEPPEPHVLRFWR